MDQMRANGWAVPTFAGVPISIKDLFDVGDEVEIRSQMGKRWPGLSIVREVVRNRYTGSVQYELEQRGMMLPLFFDDTDLSPVKFLHDTD